MPARLPSIRVRVSPRAAAAACVFTALAPATLDAQAQVWTVDDDGPADFGSIAAAIAAPQVAAGDVLQVAAGHYGSFTLDKPLHVIGAAGATPTSFWIDDFTPVRVRDVVEFSLVGMACAKLEILRVSGAGSIDGCAIGTTLSPSVCQVSGPCFVDWGATLVEDCAQLLVTRSSFRGTDMCYPQGPSESTDAFTARRSRVALVDCYLEGGGAVGEGWDCLYHYPSNAVALELEESSDVFAAGSTLRGGLGQFADPPAVRVDASSIVRVRGSASHLVESLSAAPAFGGQPGARATVSGVTLVPPQLPAWVVAPQPAEPYVLVTGGDAPGDSKQVELYGVPGAVAVLCGSLHATWFELAPDLPALWLDPGALFPAVVLHALGQETPATFALQLPPDPALSGIALRVQGWLPPFVLDGTLTNPAALVLRW